MKSSAIHHPRRRVLMALGAAVVLAVAMLTAAVAVFRTSGPAAERAAPVASGPVSPDPVVASGPSNQLAPILETPDANQFAREAASALFAWDTRSSVPRAAHMDHLVAVADPTGESSPGLVGDLDTYLPSQEMWGQLAQYETRQWLTIESAETPAAWAVAEAQAGDTLAPGTTAVTVRGVRHRAGVWEGVPVTSTHDVAFTVFVVCGPSYEQCYLLRLSMLDHPLE